MKTFCIHWKDCHVRGGGCCNLGRFGGKPSYGICAICPDHTGRPRGLGDWIYFFAHPASRWINRLVRRPIFGRGKCRCESRRQRLNQWISFNRRS